MPQILETEVAHDRVRDSRVIPDDLMRLPQRAVVCFAIRCAKRVEPIVDLDRVLSIAFALGLEIPFQYQSAATAAAAAYAAASTGDVDPAYSTFTYSDTAAKTTRAACAGHADFQSLLQLDLGEPGTPGEPIHPLDPRLGPLWPNGEPEWSIEAKKLCRELSEKVRRFHPGPPMAPLSEGLKARLAEMRRLDGEQGRGTFDQYRGEHLIAADGKLLGHGKDIYKIRKQANTKAKKEGIPLDHLVEYYVDNLE